MKYANTDWNFHTFDFCCVFEASVDIPLMFLLNKYIYIYIERESLHNVLHVCKNIPTYAFVNNSSHRVKQTMTYIHKRASHITQWCNCTWVYWVFDMIIQVIYMYIYIIIISYMNYVVWIYQYLISWQEVSMFTRPWGEIPPPKISTLVKGGAKTQRCRAVGVVSTCTMGYNCFIFFMSHDNKPALLLAKLSIESWMFNRDPFLMVYEIIPT